jgi:hypothetical protein
VNYGRVEGDLDGDGRADVVGRDAGATRAALFAGGVTGPNSAPLLLYVGEDPSYASALAHAGDVNGDGFGDLLAGAPTFAGGGSNRGKVYLYLGSATPDAAPDLVIVGAVDDADFGMDLSSGGDLDGDGYADFVVGAPALDDFSLTRPGAAYVYRGAASPSATPYFGYTSAATTSQRIGSAVARAGDEDGDGYEDIAVLAPGVGQIYYFHGGTAPTVVPYKQRPLASITNAPDGATRAGDVNGDGKDDLLVGYSGYGSGTGSFELCLGGGVAGCQQKVGTVPSAALGRGISGGLDVNGDGFADFVVGSPGDGNGKAWLYLGKAGATADLSSPIPLPNLATSPSGHGNASSLGDYDGNGYADITVGASNVANPSPQNGNGVISFYRGAASPPSTFGYNLLINGATHLGPVLAR